VTGVGGDRAGSMTVHCDDLVFPVDDAVDAGLLRAQREPRRHRHHGQAAQQEPRRPGVARDGAPPRGDQPSGAASQPLRLRPHAGGRHRADALRVEPYRLRVDDGVGLVHQREQLDLDTSCAQGLHLADDERLRGARETRHHIGRAHGDQSPLRLSTDVNVATRILASRAKDMPRT